MCLCEPAVTLTNFRSKQRQGVLMLGLGVQADTAKLSKEKKITIIVDDEEVEKERQLAQREEELVMDLIGTCLSLCVGVCVCGGGVCVCV